LVDLPGTSAKKRIALAGRRLSGIRAEDGIEDPSRAGAPGAKSEEDATVEHALPVDVVLRRCIDDISGKGSARSAVS